MPANKDVTLQEMVEQPVTKTLGDVTGLSVGEGIGGTVAIIILLAVAAWVFFGQ